MLDAIVHHWPEYFMEAGLLGLFMVSACTFGSLLEHPDSAAVCWMPCGLVRRAVMGTAMGCTAVGLIYSPWGQQSGAHMNPATTVSFLVLGKIAAWDALFYTSAQFLGAAGGVAFARFLLRDRLRHSAVNHVVTTPGRHGVCVAWIAELLIAFGMMFTVLSTNNDPLLTPYTGLIAGTLVAIYITIEAPLSGMSMNPARSFGSAFVAKHWRAFWVYLTAPLGGMLLASCMFAGWPGHHHVYCAKLDHTSGRECIFRCEFDQLRGRIGAKVDNRP